MAVIESRQSVVKQWILAKQENEQRLARALYEQVFNGSALPNVRKIALAALGTMLNGDGATALKSLNTERFLRLYQRTSYRWSDARSATYMIGSLYEKADSFDASDCSDVVRLFGQWIEDGGLLAPGASGTTTDAWGKQITTSNAIKDAYRGGVSGGKGDWKTEVEGVWADGKGKFANAPGRRVRSDGWEVEAHVASLMRDVKSFSGMGGVKGKGSKRASGDSNVLKLDRLFGLLVGADISGTTTDTVAALETVYNLGATFLTATYYLLPMATIVYNCHHTLIEVALSLSLNKCIDYRIGFYQSLLPTDKYRGAEVNSVEKILNAAENSVENRHFLVWYQGGEVAGAVHFNRPWEVNVLRQQELSRATSMLQQAPFLSPLPSFKDVAGIVHRMAPQLEIALKGRR